MRFSARCSLVGGILGILVSNTELSAQSSNDETLIAAYKNALSNNFFKLKNGAAPLYMASYKIADTWDSSMSHLLEEAQRCFGAIRIRSDSDSIPTVSFKEEASVGFALRLRSLFDASAKGAGSAYVTISFDDVVQQSIIEGELRRGYKQDACPLLKAVLSGDELLPGGAPPVVIGRLYMGKRRITVAYTDAAEAAAKLQSFVGLPPGTSVEVGAKVGLEKALIVTDRDRVPLAFSPAFVPVQTSGRQGPQNVGRPTYAWFPYDPVTFPSQTLALTDLARSVNRAWSWTDGSP